MGEQGEIGEEGGVIEKGGEGSGEMESAGREQ